MKNIAFTSVRTEGGLLPVDLLQRVALLDPDLDGLRAADYDLAPGERINDAIVRSWNRLLPIWDRFAERLAKLPDSETSADTQTRNEWTKFLLEELGYPPLEAARPAVIEDKEYPVSHRACSIAVHLVGARVDLDHRPAMGGRAPHSMVQEFLNRDDGHLWAVVTNGVRLQLLRDNSSLTRQAYCEFDLEAIFAGQLYSEFALCWLTAHASRLVPREEGLSASSCWLQVWSDTAQTEGVRALDDLRAGVEQAIEALGTGLLTPTNTVLRERLRSGELTTVELQRQILRVVYRLMFLLVAESRDLLHDPEAKPDAVERYRDSYSMERLVALARRQKGSLHHDLWAGLQITFRALAQPGAPALGLIGLGSFLWSPNSIPDLVGADIPNRALLEAIDHLTTVEIDKVLRRVDYKNLGAEELGGIYESLLETHLEVDVDGQRVNLATAAGNERKTTGSYYTPTPLIRVLLDSALDPVLDEAEQADDPEAALLALRVLDPAVGSGHFLIAAANRIAHRLAAVRCGDTEPSPGELRTALREVIAQCVYGIDVNPMSVELCKVSLWMESAEKGLPLAFLDHHIVCGNSLLGTTPALLDAGLPDEAFKALSGDDKKVVTAMKKRNKAERSGQLGFAFGAETAADARAVAAALAELDAMPDKEADQIVAKEARFAELQATAEAERLKLAADAWCAAFVAPKVVGEEQLTTDVVRRARQDAASVSAAERRLIEDLQRQYAFLHLHVAFPDVVVVPDDPAEATNDRTGWSGGFDVVLGNPPWERVKLQEKEWFATRDPAIAAAANAAARKRMIIALVEEHPELHAEFQLDLRRAEGESYLLRASGRYPLAGRGDVNTYAVFAELMATSINRTGRVGVVLPTGIATDDTTKHFFADLVDRHALVSLYDFENRRAIFPGVHRSYKFCLLTVTGDDRPAADAEFVFFALGVEDLEDEERRFSLTPDDFALLNPNTRTCPVFRSKRDARLVGSIYQRLRPLAIDAPDGPEGWLAVTRRMVHLSDNSTLFVTPGHRANIDHASLVPLVEAKSFHIFNADFATFSGDDYTRVTVDQLLDPTFRPQSRYYLRRSDVQRFVGESQAPWLVWREIARNNDERTLITCLLPDVGIAHTAYIVEVGRGDKLLLQGALSSFALDYVARSKASGAHILSATLRQLPVPTPWALNAAAAVIRPIVLELSYTGWWLRDATVPDSYQSPPFRWDPGRRRLLRAELDGLMFHLYGIERDDVDYIMETFPIVKRKDEAEFGEYLTKRLILERYDAMAEAEAAGVEYETCLDPPPADPSLCHPESTRPDWARPSA